MRWLLAVSLIVLPVLSKAAPVMPCDTGPIPLATILTPGFTCQQQDKIFSNFDGSGIPADSTVQFHSQALPSGDVHTVQLVGNFLADFVFAYTIMVDTAIAPNLYINHVAAGIDLATAGPSLLKEWAGGSVTSIGPLASMPVMAQMLAITDTFTANNGAAVSISNSFSQTTIPEPSTYVLIGLGAILLGFLKPVRKTS